MKRLATVMLKIAFVIAAAFVHSSVVSYSVFFGSVLDTRLPHYVLQGVAFVMLLPFGPLIFIPSAVEVSLDSRILLFSSLSWGSFTYGFFFERFAASVVAFVSESTPTPNQCAPANRRPAGQSDGPGEFRRDSCSRRALPAAVA